MFGLRCIRVLLFCFMALISIVEYFPQIVIGSAGMVALFAVCSQNVLPGVVMQLYHECVVGILASELLIRRRDRGATGRKPERRCSYEAIEIACQLSLQFRPGRFDDKFADI
jgi:hypothetical protein